MYRILIVDDEKKEREGISRLIARYKYPLEVKQACNGEEALRQFEKRDFDILLTDIKMPLMDGMKLIEEVHRRGKSPISIIYSAYGEFEYAQNAISLGVLEYLLKPIQLDSFQKLMNKMIDLCKEKESRKQERQKIEKERYELLSYKMNQRLLRYLENEGEISFEDAEGIQAEFQNQTSIPVILSFYSNLFSMKWDSYKEDIEKIFQEPHILMSKEDNQILVILQTERKRLNYEKISEEFEKVQNLTKRKYQTDVFIVIGNGTIGLPNLKKEYEEIKDQLDYQFFITDSTIILRNKVYFEKKEQNMLSLYFDRIYNCAKISEFHGMKKEFEKVFTYIENQTGFSSIYVKYTFIDAIKKISEYTNFNQKLIAYMEKIYSAKTFEEVSKVVYEVLECMQKNHREEIKENRIVHMAKEWIYEHYRDSNLGVASIAFELNVSTAYMSSLFKIETGQNLVKFITQLRVEKSKELLKNTNMKVSDVANCVGYINASYFISIFRSYEGCSPTQYRERMTSNE